MKGVYVLVISVNEGVKINVGILGDIDFGSGMYAYVGSAQKSLEKRVARHLRKDKIKFWHIDYLTTNEDVKITKVFYRLGEGKLECEIAQRIGQKGFPIRSFGSSDCKCESHLFKMKNLRVLEELLRIYRFNDYLSASQRRNIVKRDLANTT